MLGMRASAKRLRERLGVTKSGPRFDSDSAESGALTTHNAALVAQAIFYREKSGRTTTLRQIHTIVDLGQPEALRVVHELEANGLLVIHADINDTFESKIELTNTMRDRLENILGASAT